MNPWLVFASGWLGVWLIIFLLKPSLRREMFWVSLFTMPIGLTEPLFVPEYWNPPSLFDLAAKTGFDIESLIFMFAIGGIGAVLYESIANVSHRKISKRQTAAKKFRWHFISIIIPALIWFLLVLFTNLNPIYPAALAFFIGAVMTMFCRPDLTRFIWLSGGVAAIIYFIYFICFNLFYPGFVSDVWNLSALSGILIFGIPLEELLVAYVFAMMWCSIYEHILDYRIKRKHSA